jgi:nicotinamide riboside transporter PnuC
MDAMKMPILASCQDRPAAAGPFGFILVFIYIYIFFECSQKK